MNAMRRALTTRLQANATVLASGATVLQEDELTKDTAVPAIVIAYAGEHPYKDSAIFFRERWALIFLSQNGDYFTISQLAKAIRADLNRATLDAPAGETTAGLDVEWVMNGPSSPDDTYKMHSLIQYYEIISQEF